MKKYIKVIIILLLIFPIFVKCATFDSALYYANNFINSFSDCDRYLLIRDGLPYDKSDSSYKRGGLLTKNEFEIIGNGNIYNSWLYNVIGYWSSTKDGTTKHYVLDEKLNSYSNSTSHRVRVSEFVKSDTQVSGKGSFNDPWIFAPQYMVTVNAGDHGTINGEKSASLVVSSGNTAEFTLTPEIGYKYISNNCGSNVEVVSNVLKVKYVTKNMECSVKYIYGDKSVTLYVENISGSNSGPWTNPDPLVLYRETSVNWFKNSALTEVVTKIRIPAKTGYTFLGYDADVEDNKGNVTAKELIDKNGVITLNPQEVVKSVKFLYEPNKYDITFNFNGGEAGTAKTVATYDANMPQVVIPKRRGYRFLGYKYNNAYYYDSNGKSSRTWNVASNATLVAQWEICPPGKYLPYGENEYRICPGGYPDSPAGSSSINQCRYSNSCVRGENTCRYGCGTCGGGWYRCGSKIISGTGAAGCNGMVCFEPKWCEAPSYSCNCDPCKTGHNSCEAGYVYYDGTKTLTNGTRV